MDVVARMVVASKEEKDGGHVVSLRCVTAEDDKGAEFFKYTPWGECKMGVLSEFASAQFVPGETYSVTFSKVE